jgi:hypothetical protein
MKSTLTRSTEIGQNHPCWSDEINLSEAEFGQKLVQEDAAECMEENNESNGLRAQWNCCSRRLTSSQSSGFS